jgi:transposase-like protein
MDMQNISLITLAWELYCNEVSQLQIARDIHKNRETVHRWIKGVKQHGLMKFLDLYDQAKKGKRTPRKADLLVKKHIWDIRDREQDCCGQKIQYFLEKEYGLHLSVPKIYQVLSEKYVIRSKWKKNKARGPIPHPESPREVVQMDSIDFGGLFAFTAIDCFSREADILLAPELTSEYGFRFLRQSMERRFDHRVKLIQTDGGPEFKDQFTNHVRDYCDRHRISRPYKKNEQSFVESFNRSVRKECLGWQKYNPNQIITCTQMVESFLQRYHYHRPHMGLGMKPPLTK